MLGHEIKQAKQFKKSPIYSDDSGEKNRSDANVEYVVS